MLRAALIAGPIGAALATGAILARPEAGAHAAAPGSAATVEARRALAQARGEAMRARERSTLLDRQARSSLSASDKATLAAAALAARVQQSEAAVAMAEADLRMVSHARRVLDARLTRESAPVARLLAGLQKQLRRPPVLQLLQPGSIADAVHLRAVVVAVEPQIRTRTTLLRRELSRASALEGESARIAAQRRTLQSDLMARRSELAALSAAERLRARRASGAADREAERAFAIGEGARDISTLVRRLEGAGSRREPPDDATRSLTSGPQVPATADRQVPHRLPVQGRLAAVQTSPRKGMTLETRPGALVVSPGAGKVAFAGPYRGFGNIVIVEHADGWTSLLTGLATARVAIGQPVVAGSPLGEAAGRNPRVTIELRRSGIPIDPSRQLR